MQKFYLLKPVHRLIISKFIQVLACLFTGDKTAATAACSDQPRASGRPKRKLISNPDNASSLPEDRNEEQPERQRHNVKRVRRVMGRDKPSAGNAALLPSKGTPFILVDYNE